MKPNPIPSDYPLLSPSIATRDTASAIEFYKKVLGAEERMRLTEPSGKIAHAELQFGTAMLMLADKYEPWNTTPDELGGRSTVVLHLYVEDVDATVNRAVEAGAKLLMAPADQFYGDRCGRVLDPFDHVWVLSSRVEDVSHEEMHRRFTQAPPA